MTIVLMEWCKNGNYERECAAERYPGIGRRESSKKSKKGVTGRNERATLAVHGDGTNCGGLWQFDEKGR